MVCASELVSALAVLLGAQTAAMLTPGPNMLLLLGTAELRVRLLKYTVAGFASAGLVFSIASIAALHLTHDGSMDAPRRVLQLAGALYLVHAGVGLVRSACAAMGRGTRPGGGVAPRRRCAARRAARRPCPAGHPLPDRVRHQREQTPRPSPSSARS